MEDQVLRKPIIFCAVTIFAVILSIGETHANNLRSQLAKESTLEQVLQRKVLKVGMSTFVPWAMQDKTGKLIGFEIDVAKRLAKDMGVSIEFVPTKWSGIIPALLTGKFDIVIGGMGITPERSLKVNFSRPYDTGGMAIVANKKLASGFSALEDFNRPEVTLVARLGATPVAASKKFMPKANLRLFDDEAQCVQELLNGRAHGFVSLAPTPAHLAFKNQDKLFLPIKGTFTKEPIGFAVRKGDFDMVNFLNNWIEVVEAEGWFNEKRHYWFEKTEWESFIK